MVDTVPDAVGQGPGDAATWVTGELLEASEMLRIEGEAAPIGSWKVELPGRAITWSPEVAYFHGKPGVATLPLDEWLDHFPGAAAERIRKAIETAVSTGAHFDESIQISSENQAGWLRVTGEATRGDDGPVTGIRGTMHDVTASLAQAEALIQSEGRFRIIADSLPHMVWMTDAAGNLSFANEAAYAFAGVEKSVPVAEFWLDTVHPDDRKPCIETWVQCVAESARYETEFRIRRHDGVYRWQRISAVPVRDEENAITGWYGAGLDIHEMVEARTTASRLASRFTAMLESISDGFLTFDRDWTMTYANTRFVECASIHHAAARQVLDDKIHEFDLAGLGVVRRVEARERVYGGSALQAGESAQE